MSDGVRILVQLLAITTRWLPYTLLFHSLMGSYLLLNIYSMQPCVLPQGTTAVYVGQQIALIEGHHQILVAMAALQKGYDPVLIKGNTELFQYFEAENLIDCVDALEALDETLYLSATIDDDDEFIQAIDQLMTAC